MNIHILLALSLAALIAICDGYTTPPPEGLYFMLRTMYETEYCMYSSQTKNKPKMASCDEDNDEFWWTIVTYNTNVFYLKNKGDSKCLYESGTGYQGFDVSSCEDLVKFRWQMDGVSDDSDYFRLMNIKNSKCISGSLHYNEYNVGRYNCGGLDVKYWTFEYEGYTLSDLSYTATSATTVTDAPAFSTLLSCNNTGGGTADQTVSITYSEEETWEESYEYSSGFEMSIGTEFSAETPIGLSTTLSVTQTFSTTQTWGASQSVTKTIEGSVETVCAEGESLQTTIIITSTTYEIPYTMTFTADSDSTMVFYTYGTCSVKYWIVSASTSDASAVIPYIGYHDHEYHPQTELGIVYRFLYWFIALLVVSLCINIGFLFKCIFVKEIKNKYEMVSESA